MAGKDFLLFLNIALCTRNNQECLGVCLSSVNKDLKNIYLGVVVMGLEARAMPAKKPV